MSAAESHEAKQRAMREGRIAARLQHPHAIAVYDVAEEDGNPWLIMEYLPSRSLSAVLAERGTMPPQETARVLAQAAMALDAAHAAGIVHRDIKPGNILIGNDGTVKITDFGISRATGDVTVTATGMLAGTPAYLAPEVAKGYDPGPPSDVFSLGSTVYASVEGEPPFGLNENTLALLHLVAAGVVNPPRQAGPLHALLMRLLAADPKERPTMRQAHEGLSAVAAGRPVPPALLSSPSAPTWRVNPPPAPGTTRQIAPPVGANPMGPGPTRLDARPFDRQPQPTRVGGGPMGTGMMGSGPNTRPPGLRPG
jgi:serine/threonine protein kinase